MSFEIFNYVLLVLLNGTLILGLSLLVTRLLGWLSASMRHLTLLSALLSVVLLVPASSILPSWDLPELPGISLFSGMADSEEVNITEPQPEIGSGKGDEEDKDTVTARELEESDTEKSSPSVGRTMESGSLWMTVSGFFSSYIHWIVWVLWIAGSVVILIIQLVRWAGAGFIASMASKVENKNLLQISARISKKLRIRKQVALLQSEMTAVTMAWGIRKPCIILPSDSGAWSGDRIEAVLQHEFAHIKRKDNLLHLFAVAASAFFWFNPLVWIVMRRLNYEREVACDDQVLNSGIYASSYARHLMDLNVRLVGPKSERIVPAVMAHSSNIKRRLLSILDPKVNRRPLKPLYAFLYLMLILGLALPIAGFQPWTPKKTDDNFFIFTGRYHAGGPDSYNIFYIDGRDCVFYPDRPLEFKLVSPDSYLILCKHDEEPAIRFEVRVAKDGDYETTFYLDDKKQAYDQAAEELFRQLLNAFGSSEESKELLSDKDDSDRRRKWREDDLYIAEPDDEWLESILEDSVYSIEGEDYSFDSSDPLNFKLLSPDSYMILRKDDIEPIIEFRVQVGNDGKYITSFYVNGKQRVFDKNAELLFRRILTKSSSRDTNKTSRRSKDYSSWYRQWRAGELDFAEAFNEWLGMVDEDLICNQAYMSWKEMQTEDELVSYGEYEEWIESRDKDQILKEAFIRWMEAKSLEKRSPRETRPKGFIDENRIADNENAITIGDTIDALLGNKGDLSLDFKHAEIDIDTDWLYRITEPNGYLIVTRLVDDVISRYEIRSSPTGRITKRHIVDGAVYRFDDNIEKQFRNLLLSMFDVPNDD